MNNVKLTPASVGLAILVGTLMGPISQLAKGITTAQMMDVIYWADLAAATLTAFATVTLAMLGLIASAIGIPILRGTNTPTQPPTNP